MTYMIKKKIFSSEWKKKDTDKNKMAVKRMLEFISEKSLAPEDIIDQSENADSEDEEGFHFTFKDKV